MVITIGVAMAVHNIICYTDKAADAGHADWLLCAVQKSYLESHGSYR